MSESGTLNSLMRVLDAQERLNDSVTRCLESLALSGERYDSEIHALRSEIRQLRVLVDGLMQSEHYTAKHGHSIRVAVLEEGGSDDA